MATTAQSLEVPQIVTSFTATEAGPRATFAFSEGGEIGALVLRLPAPVTVASAQDLTFGFLLGPYDSSTPDLSMEISLEQGANAIRYRSAINPQQNGAWREGAGRMGAQIGCSPAGECILKFDTLRLQVRPNVAGQITVALTALSY